METVSRVLTSYCEWLDCNLKYETEQTLLFTIDITKNLELGTFSSMSVCSYLSYDSKNTT